MPYRVEYRPAKGRPPWAKVRLLPGGRTRIVSRHRTRAAAEASIRAYYATRNDENQILRNQLVFNRINPARTDPSRTAAIRRRFVAEVRRLFQELFRAVRELIVELDAFGLAPHEPGLTGLQSGTGGITPRAYVFRTAPEKARLFRDWLDERLRGGLVRVVGQGDAARPWTYQYIESTARIARMNAWIETKREAGLLPVEREEFVRRAFLQPESLSKIRLLSTRAFEQLRGIGADVAARMNRVFADALTEGLGPRETAQRLVASTAMPKARAEMIARTETIHAHAEVQLDAYQELGVRGVGIRAEWSTAGDDRVCPDCAAREGKVFDMDEARGLIPFHPNCRCAWLPVLES